MTSQFDSIPVVDIGPLYSSNIDDREKVAKEIGRIAHDIGFMYIVGHHVSEDVISGLKEATKEFFALPEEEKMKIYVGNSKSHKGYVPEGEEVYHSKFDHKETVTLGPDYTADSPQVTAQLPLVGLNQWPDEQKLPRFRERVVKYFNEVLKLAKVMVQGFALALGQEVTEFDKYFEDPLITFRLIHYFFDETSKLEETQGIGEHTDFECFTILLAEQAGLEVKNSANEWIKADPVPNSFVINFGDLLEIMTNHRVTATKHRVKQVPEERYSFPFFVGPNYHTRIKPFPQFANETSEKYPGVITGEHIWNEVLKTYKYLLDKLKTGELKMADEAKLGF